MRILLFLCFTFLSLQGQAEDSYMQAMEHMEGEEPRVEEPKEEVTEAEQYEYISIDDEEPINWELTRPQPPEDFCPNKKKPYRWFPLECSYKGALGYVSDVSFWPNLADKFKETSCKKGQLFATYEIGCEASKFTKESVGIWCRYSNAETEFLHKGKWEKPWGRGPQGMCEKDNEGTHNASDFDCPPITNRRTLSETNEELVKFAAGVVSREKDFCGDAHKTDRLYACVTEFFSKDKYCPKYETASRRLKAKNDQFLGIGCCRQDEN